VGQNRLAAGYGRRFKRLATVRGFVPTDETSRRRF
jgi:hypothetical protein